MKIDFIKMHGAGNDFVMIENYDRSIELNSEQVVALCDRHFGVGADAVILVEKRENEGEIYMNYYNSDGSFAEMCGNGIRAIAHLYKKTKGFSEKSLEVGTPAGIKTVQIEDDDLYTVNMGKANYDSEDFPSENKTIEGFDLNFVSMGNPHAVAFVDDVDSIDLNTVGPKIEHDSNFPNRINFEIIETVGENHLKKRVWERGSGLTLCCGSGTCAAYRIAKDKGIIKGKTIFDVPGGRLIMDENETGEILMTGPAEIVFTGSIEI